MKHLLSLALLILAFQFTNAQVANSAEEISPLLVGEKIPSTSVISSKGKELKTDNLFKEQNTILIVYRGGWCPYCNRQLEGLRTIEDDLISLGYQIVAVSPDAIPEVANKYSSKYLLISDGSTKLMQNLGIAFKAPTKYGDMLSKASKGLNTGVLPAPSVYIINKKSEILFEYISPDYKNRINENLLLSAAKALK